MAMPAKMVVTKLTAMKKSTGVVKKPMKATTAMKKSTGVVQRVKPMKATTAMKKSKRVWPKRVPTQQIIKWMKEKKIDVACLQETKVSSNSKFLKATPCRLMFLNSTKREA